MCSLLFFRQIGNCRTALRGKKWYYPLFLYLFDISIVNAWLLFRMSADGNKIDLNSFRTSIAESLLSKNEKKKQTVFHSKAVQHDRKGHLIDYNSKQNRCRVCKKNANFFCQKCNVHLHPKECFKAFHAKQ